MRTWMAALLALTLLAGCSDNGSDPPAEEDPTDELGLESTATTGVIRGVVVDEAVRPLSGVSIVIAGTTLRNTTSNDAGAFGFSNLEPGTYFLTASKPGFGAQQAQADVRAGVDEPALTRFQLQADPSTQPFFESQLFEGYIQCSVSFVAAGLAACSLVEEFSGDRFSVTYEYTRTPDWLQSEMVWESTQSVSESLSVAYSAGGDGALLTNWVEDAGPSPLLLQSNQTLAAQWGVGNGSGLFIRVFNEPIDGTTPPDPTSGDACVDRPFLGGCATGVGVTLQQKFVIYTHSFYGYTPGETWRFTDGSAVPAPPA